MQQSPEYPNLICLVPSNLSHLKELLYYMGQVDAQQGKVSCFVGKKNAKKAKQARTELVLSSNKNGGKWVYGVQFSWALKSYSCFPHTPKV